MIDIVLAVVQRLQEADTVAVPVYSRKPPHKIDGTGSAFLVVSDAGTWGGTNLSGHRQRRLVRVALFVDAERDEFGLPVNEDAAHRAWAVWSGVDSALHDIEHGWIAVTSSRRDEEPSEYPVDGAEHAALLSGTFEVSA